jgi:hypothetical protein
VEPAPPPGAYDAAGELVDPDFVAARDAYGAALSDYGTRLAKHEAAMSGQDSHIEFRRLLMESVRTERAAISLLERAHTVIDDFGIEALSNNYFVLVERFLEKYSLRYDLRRPFSLQPTITGIFTGLVRSLRDVTRQDAHLHQMMVEFEDAVRDLRAGTTPTRIKTCIQKQFNLLEAIGRLYPNVNQQTLGAICDQVGTWPHSTVKDAMKNLYRFASDYPGIRHGGTPNNALRNIDMKDMVAMTVLLAGFTPYLSHQLDSDIAYRGQ